MMRIWRGRGKGEFRSTIQLGLLLLLESGDFHIYIDKISILSLSGLIIQYIRLLCVHLVGYFVLLSFCILYSQTFIYAHI